MAQLVTKNRSCGYLAQARPSGTIELSLRAQRLPDAHRGPLSLWRVGAFAGPIPNGRHAQLHCSFCSSRVSHTGMAADVRGSGNTLGRHSLNLHRWIGTTAFNFVSGDRSTLNLRV